MRESDARLRPADDLDRVGGGDLGRRDVDPRVAALADGAGRSLEVGQGTPRVATGESDEVALRFVVDGDRAIQTAFVGERSVDHGPDVVVTQRLEGEQQ